MRAPVAVRAAGDNEVDVDAIVKDIQTKVWRGVIGWPAKAGGRERVALPPHPSPRGHAAPTVFVPTLTPPHSLLPHPTLHQQWDAVEDKPSAILYAGGAVVLLWLASTVVGAVNAIPLLPKLLELVGLGYTAWFVYRYLLFKSSREELLADIEELKKKITS